MSEGLRAPLTTLLIGNRLRGNPSDSTNTNETSLRHPGDEVVDTTAGHATAWKLPPTTWRITQGLEIDVEPSGEARAQRKVVVGGYEALGPRP